MSRSLLSDDYCPNRLAAIARIGHDTTMEQTAVAKLSEMQVACLRLVADLKKTEQIAGELGISPSTVNTHIERAIARLGVANRREAARLVMAHASEAIAAPSPSAPQAPPETSTMAEPAGLPTDTAPTISDTDQRDVPSSSDSRREKLPTEKQRLFGALAAALNPSLSTTAKGPRRNNLTIPQRLLAGFVALVLLCLAIAGLGAAIEQLSHWRASYAVRR